MSSFMVESRTLAYIANFIAVQMNQGFKYTDINSVDFSCFADCIKDGFANAEEIYKRLYQLNFDAYLEYLDHYCEEPDDECTMEAFPNTKIHKPKVCAVYHIVVEEWHYQMLKSMEYYLFQCCEGDCPKTEVYQAIERFKNALMEFIVHNSIEWHAAK